jgi:hypothetical protein
MRSTPGCAASRSQRAARGDSLGDDPPLVDLLALASRSTNVIARQRKRWRAIPLSAHSPVSRFLTPTTDSTFPGHPVPIVPAARSATPVTRFASLADRLVATQLPRSSFPGPASTSEDPEAGWIIPLPAPLSPREPGWPSVPQDPHCWRPDSRHRSSSSGWRALSGTRVACTNSTPQVKRYFSVHRVIRRLSPQSPEVFLVSTFCAQVLHSVHVVVG